MSVTASSKTSQEYDSVKAILIELNGIYKQQAEIRDTLVAKGVTLATVNMLLNLQSSGPPAEFKKHCTSAVSVAFERYGGSAVKHTELESSLRKLVEHDEDALFVRRIAKGMGLNAQALSMLTNIIRQNPGDDGKLVLTELFSYAAEYGVRLDALRAVEEDDDEPASVLPDIVIEETGNQGLLKYKNIALELVLALIVTSAALALLT